MNTTLHEISPEEIMAHFDGELSADRAREVAAHLACCAACGALAAALGTTSRALNAWQVAEPKRLEARETCFFPRSAAPSWQLLVNRRALLGLLALLSAMALGFFEIAGKLPRSMSAPRVDINNDAPHEARVAGAGGLGVSDDKAATRFAPESREPVRSLPMNGRSVTSLGTLTPGDALGAPLIARSVELQIVAKDFAAVRGKLDAVLVRHQGYAASLSVSNTDNTPRALSASLRIPAPQLAAALNELKSLGPVMGEAQSGEEVTSQRADLAARSKNSRETEIRLQDILRTRTGKVSDILEVEQEIARVRGEIEQLESELKTLNHRVDFATINLTIHEEYQAKLGGGTPAMALRLHNAAVTGLASAACSSLGMLLWLIEVMPSLLLWVIVLGGPVWWLWRRTQRVRASAI
jgi:anti-sigma factor RsiW